MDKLADLIKRNDSKMRSIFTKDFQTLDGWRGYLKKNFAVDSDQPVTKLLGTGMTAQAFQALYIVCWIHSPFEKGTFMIRLTSAQRARVKAGYDKLKLGWRKSSHLHKKGRSAAGFGWKFLNGYSELLVQMEGGGKNTVGFEPNLFLKCEGHLMWAPKHGKSWVTKKRTGKGDTASPALNELAKSNTVDGMRERAAENYSKEYKQVLKELGLKGKTQTVRDVAFALYKKLVALGRGDRLPRLGNHLTDADPKRLAKALEDILQAFDELDGPDPVKDAVQKAKRDFKTIIENLKTDEDGSDRFFAEVKVTPDKLDKALVDFLKELGAAA
jgi:hypothetical protein